VFRSRRNHALPEHNQNRHRSNFLVSHHKNVETPCHLVPYGGWQSALRSGWFHFGERARACYNTSNGRDEVKKKVLVSIRSSIPNCIGLWIVCTASGDPLMQTRSTHSSRATNCPRRSFMLHLEKFEMRKRLLTLPLTRPKQNAEGILKSYEPFLSGVTRCITNVFGTNVLQVATT
jgi:hypothetical protein